MVAGPGLRSHMTIDAGIEQPVRQGSRQQQVVETQSRISLPSVSHVVPESVDALIRVHGSQGVDEGSGYTTLPSGVSTAPGVSLAVSRRSGAMRCSTS